MVSPILSLRSLLLRLFANQGLTVTRLLLHYLSMDILHVILVILLPLQYCSTGSPITMDPFLRSDLSSSIISYVTEGSLSIMRSSLVTTFSSSGKYSLVSFASVVNVTV